MQQTKWKEDLKKIKVASVVHKRKPVRKRIRKRTATKRYVGDGLANMPFSGLGAELERKRREETGKSEYPIIKKYHSIADSETEMVIVRSYYSITQVERLIKRLASLRKTVASIKALEGGYYQIKLIKEPLYDGSLAAQRIRLNMLGEVVAFSTSKLSANGLQKKRSWEFEEEEDLGYY